MEKYIAKVIIRDFEDNMIFAKDENGYYGFPGCEVSYGEDDIQNLMLYLFNTYGVEYSIDEFESLLNIEMYYNNFNDKENINYYVLPYRGLLMDKKVVSVNGLYIDEFINYINKSNRKINSVEVKEAINCYFRNKGKGR